MTNNYRDIRPQVELQLERNPDDIASEILIYLAANKRISPAIAHTKRPAGGWMYSLTEILREKLSEKEKVVRKRICIDFGYCKFKDRSDTDRALLIIDSGLILVLGFSLPVVSTAAYMVHIGLLNEFCGCE